MGGGGGGGGGNMNQMNPDSGSLYLTALVPETLRPFVFESNAVSGGFPARLAPVKLVDGRRLLRTELRVTE